MKTILVFSCIAALTAAMGIGVAKYRRIDNAMRIVVIYIIFQLASEVLVYVTGELKEYTLRKAITNISIVANICLITQFFINAIKPKFYKKLTIANMVMWPCISVLNILFLQTFNEIDSNFLLAESFGTIAMSLYLIYSLLKDDDVHDVFSHPYFRIALLWLLMWSATMFFWATIKVLYRNHWKYTQIFMHIHAAITLVVYIGISATLLFYPKKERY